MDSEKKVLANPYYFLSPPKVITATCQLPPFNSEIPSLLWSPCVIDALCLIPFDLTVNDLYIKTLVLYFFNTNSICSNELCQAIPYCQPLWIALYVSNYIKRDPNSSYSCKNKYIHPVMPYNHQKHLQQHNQLTLLHPHN
jgi:hypothetical protein